MPGQNSKRICSHNIFKFDEVLISSDFDNGNLFRAERGQSSYEYLLWTAPDNCGETYESKHNAWFHFVVSGVREGICLKLRVMNSGKHAGLYKHDMRPVYKSNLTNHKWIRIKSSVRFQPCPDGTAQLYFEHIIEPNENQIYFAFTYPYTYSMVQSDLQLIDSRHNGGESADSIYYKRELLTTSHDQLRIDLITISSKYGLSDEIEPLLPGLFPDSNVRPNIFPDKLVIFVSARVHPGEVPAQHTFKGILNFLLDPDDIRAKELRRRYVFKLIPILNPDGVYRGYFRMDTFGKNLNRFYSTPDSHLQPSIYGAKSLLDYYSEMDKLALYLDLHAHASKRGCFIYGNVMDDINDQIQNQLFCKLIALNSPHFDYEGCLFSREHMVRIDPGEMETGLTAEGSGRVASYLKYHIIHSYTLECNYNTGRVANEISSMEIDPGGHCYNVSPSPLNLFPEKYTPASYGTVGQACMVALLDIRGHNPCSRIGKSKYKTLDRLRHDIIQEQSQSQLQSQSRHPTPEAALLAIKEQRAAKLRRQQANKSSSSGSSSMSQRTATTTMTTGESENVSKVGARRKSSGGGGAAISAIDTINTTSNNNNSKVANGFINGSHWILDLDSNPNPTSTDGIKIIPSAPQYDLGQRQRTGVAGRNTTTAALRGVFMSGVSRTPPRLYTNSNGNSNSNHQLSVLNVARKSSLMIDTTTTTTTTRGRRPSETSKPSVSLSPATTHSMCDDNSNSHSRWETGEKLLMLEQNKNDNNNDNNNSNYIDEKSGGSDDNNIKNKNNNCNSSESGNGSHHININMTTASTSSSSSTKTSSEDRIPLSMSIRRTLSSTSSRLTSQGNSPRSISTSTPRESTTCAEETSTTPPLTYTSGRRSPRHIAQVKDIKIDNLSKNLKDINFPNDDKSKLKLTLVLAQGSPSRVISQTKQLQRLISTTNDEGCSSSFLIEGKGNHDQSYINSNSPIETKTITPINFCKSSDETSVSSTSTSTCSKKSTERSKGSLSHGPLLKSRSRLSTSRISTS
eukprot:gene7547-15463_t